MAIDIEKARTCVICEAGRVGWLGLNFLFDRFIFSCVVLIFVRFNFHPVFVIDLRGVENIRDNKY